MGFSWGVLMEVGIEAAGGGTFIKKSVKVSWREGNKLEIRPKVGGRNLRLGRGGGGVAQWDRILG